MHALQQSTAQAAVFLGAKISETPRRIRDVLAVFYRMQQRRRGVSRPEHLDRSSVRYGNMKSDLVKHERLILRELGFYLHVEHPQKFLLYFVQQLALSNEVAQSCWNYCNDSLRTTLCLQLRPEAIACTAIHLAAQHHHIGLPDDVPWYAVFDVSKKEIDNGAAAMRALYRLPAQLSLADAREMAKNIQQQLQDTGADLSLGQ